MKNSVLVILLSVLSFSAKAQEESTALFLKANTITVSTENSDSLNFRQFKRQLLKFDYFIANSDPEILTITTDLHNLKKHPGWSYSYMYKIIFADKNIIIKPYWKVGLTMSFYGARSTDQLIRWSYASAKGNVNNIVWLETVEMLYDYCNCKIIYSKQ